jgi:type IV secretion system protein VirB9
VRSVLAAGLLCVPAAAYALQCPQPAVPPERGGDPHIQVAAYDPNNPVLLVGAVGRPVTVTFAPNEHVTNVNMDTGYVGADGKAAVAPWQGVEDGEGAKQPTRNILPLWAVRAGRSNAQVVTATDDGATRTYQFVLVALPPQPDDCQAPGGGMADCDDPRLAYGLSFTYPASSRVPAPADQAAAQARAAAARLARKLAAEDRLKTDIFYGPRNWKYLVKGKPDMVKRLAPDQVSDNTQVTGLLYLGNRKAPSLYVVAADGSERQVSPEPDKDLLVVHETAQHWRLRSGSDVADIFNAGYDATGVNPETGTVSPNVIRVTRAASASH